MKKSNFFLLIVITLALALFFSCEKVPNPSLISVVPEFGPAETLVTFEGENLGNILSLKFSDQVVNFNTAYNSENALLFRIPTNVPLGEHVVTIETEGGEVMTNFRVTKKPPEIFSIFPESASVGEEVTLYGENFFEPVDIWFFDSVKAEITMLADDSLKVIVPQGAEKGFISMWANGGHTYSPVRFFSTNSILVNDFDGNGVRSETQNWIFQGFVNETPMNAVQNTNPASYDGNFLKISGVDDLGIGWIGGAENNAQDVTVFEKFDITADVNNTLLEMEMNSNGSEVTHVILVLLERDGSNNDFTHTFKIDWEGWKTVSFPLNRFKDLNEIIIDPQKIKTVKVHLNNTDNSNLLLEANVDNIRFVEIL